MRRKLGDLIWGQSTNGNSVGQILAQLKRDIALLRSRPVKVAALEEISPDLGTITAGRFIASSDNDPLTIIDSDTAGNAPTVSGSGVVIDGDGIPVSDGGDKAGIIGYGASSVIGFYDTVAGKRVSGAGAVVQDEDGIRLINVDDISRFIFNDPLLTYSGGDIGSIGQANGDRLSVEYDPYGNTELLSNPGFEAGALTNWTAAGAGTWSAQTTTVYRDRYAARCLLSGTSAHTLTSDRVVLAAFEVGFLIFYQYDTVVGWTEKTAYIKWYDSAAGGNLLQTDSIDLGNAGAGSWRYKFLRAVGPGNAASCEIVLSATASSGTPSVYFDAMRLRYSGQYGSIEIRGTLKGAISNGPYSTGAPPADSFFGPDVLPYWVADSNQTSPLYYGDYVGYDEVVAASVAATSGYSRTIQSGAMGANGFFIYDAWFLVSNTGGTTVSCAFTISFGGSTLHTITSAATGTSTPRYILVHFQGVVANVASESAQRAEVAFDGSANSLQDTAALSVSTTRLNGLKTATVDTSSAVRVFDITGTLSTATNSKLERLGVNLYGPYYSD